MDDLDNIVKEFLVESYENLDQLDRDLVALEKDPANRDRLGSIFRTIHTIKGTCGFFGFGKLESVSHVGENLLSRLRDGLLVLDAERTNALLAMLDAVRGMLTTIEATGSDGDGDYTGLIATLTRLLEPDAPKLAPPVEAQLAPIAEPTAPTPAAEVSTPTEEATPKPAPKRRSRKPAAAKTPGEEATPKPPPKRRSRSRAKAAPVELPPESVPAIPSLENSVPSAEAAVSSAPSADTPEPQLSTPSTPPAPTEAPAASAENKPAAEGKGHALADTNIRVDVGLLDKLMNLVGELVLARNQVLQYTATQKDAAFLGTSQRLNLITSELQEGVMKTRMQPIGNVWDRFPRIVRDLALSCGKQVRIEMEGKETELDKTIIEAIKDPLTHIVRNSVDHGIESAQKRVAAGKSAEGTLSLRAFHEGGQVNIEISDDGGGINAERVKAKALEKGLITHEQAARLGEREMVNLVFLPGFSTAEKITNVSGRGVGMDVVKTNIEKIGGTVDIQNRPGQGTTLKIKIPLTLAIIPALVVTSAGDRYAIPQVNLLELVRLDGQQARKGIERIHGAPVYRLRGNLLPLVHLDRELQVDTADKGDDEVINIVVLQADDRQFGLMVDSICDTEEIVVKPLGKHFKGIPLFAGATIMGDGRVALILDVLGIAQRAHVVSEVRDRGMADGKAVRPLDAANAAQTLLIVSLGDYRRLAIPLAQVARLEEIGVSEVERADGLEVVQYRGRIMPLLRLADIFGGSGGDGDGETLQVVVYSDEGRSAGLVVGRILDIVETEVKIDRGSRREGLLGSAVIQGHVTDMMDVAGVVRSADLVLA